MFTFAQRERIRTALEKRANRSPVRSQGKFRRLSREGRLFDKFVEKKAAEIRKLNPQASEGAILDSIIEFINSGALEKILAFITAIIGMFGVLLLALTLALSASPAAACAPGDIVISKAEGEEITREIQGQEVARLVAEAITDPKQYTEAVARERFPGMTNEWYTAHVNTERKAITWRGMTFEEQKALAPDWWEKRLIKERNDQAEEADEFGGGIGGRILEAWAEYDAIHGKGAAQKSFEDQLRRDGLIVGSNVRQVTRATPEQLPPVHKMPLPRTMKIVIRFVFGD